MKPGRAMIKISKLLQELVESVKDLQKDIDDLKRAAGIKTRSELLVIEEKKAQRKAQAQAKAKEKAEAEAEEKAKAEAEAKIKEVVSNV